MKKSKKLEVHVTTATKDGDMDSTTIHKFDTVKAAWKFFNKEIRRNDIYGAAIWRGSEEVAWFNGM